MSGTTGLRHTEIEIRHSEDSTYQQLNVIKLYTDNTSQQKNISGLGPDNSNESIIMEEEFNLSSTAECIRLTARDLVYFKTAPYADIKIR